MSRIPPFLFLPIALGALLATPARAAQGQDSCTGHIQSLPVVISTQGVWCLDQNLSTASASGAAIQINANNVTIDCNGFKLGGLGAGPATAALGVSSLDRNNATVRNCSIRGFLYGIEISGTGGGHRVEGNLVEGNTYIGISVSGDGSVVRDNRILNTGGTPLFASGLGLWVLQDVDVIDNTISGVRSTPGSNSTAYGIISHGNFGGSIQGNRVRHVVADGFGMATAISIGDNGGVVISGNHAGALLPSDNNNGILCDFDSAIVRDNIVNGFAYGIAGCNDAEGNDVTSGLP